MLKTSDLYTGIRHSSSKSRETIPLKDDEDEVFTEELGEMELLTAGGGGGGALLSPMSRLAASLDSLSLKGEHRGSDHGEPAASGDYDDQGRRRRSSGDLGSLTFVGEVSRMMAHVMADNLPAGNSDQVRAHIWFSSLVLSVTCVLLIQFFFILMRILDPGLFVR